MFPFRESVFDVVWRIKVPKKVRFFVWPVLRGCVNTMDWLVRRGTSLVGLFDVFFVRRQRKTLIISFGIGSMCGPCGALFC